MELNRQISLLVSAQVYELALANAKFEKSKSEKLSLLAKMLIEGFQRWDSCQIFFNQKQIPVSLKPLSAAKSNFCILTRTFY